MAKPPKKACSNAETTLLIVRPTYLACTVGDKNSWTLGVFHTKLAFLRGILQKKTSENCSILF